MPYAWMTSEPAPRRYNYLRRFDVDFLKIDGPFLKAAGNAGATVD